MSMQTVYADSLVLLNAVIDYLLLLSAGKLCALPLRRPRIAVAALWGGVYALLAVLIPRPFAMFTVKLLAGALAVALAYGVSGKTPKAMIAFYAVAAAFGGAVYAAASLSGRNPAGGIWVAVSPRMLLLSFAFCYAAVTLVFRRIAKRAERALCSVKVELCGRSAAFPALMDTGNELYDPVSGDGAVVAEAGALAALLEKPENLLRSDPLSVIEGLNASGAPKWRLLPCSCAAGERQLLLCFRPDALWVDGRLRKDLLVAVSRNRLSPDEAYRAVVPGP